MSLSRRRLLATLPLAAAGCATHRAVTPAPAPLGPHLERVDVSADRVIRVTVGLRPFRPSGFVVRAEKLGEKTVIHNYGHGGSGITLSWGTAQQAVDLAAGVDARECAVIGCGVIGLSTARLLQLRGYKPAIYTQAMPPNTTTNMAGGLWEPVSLYDDDRITPEFRAQFASAASFAWRYFQFLAGDTYAVRWLPLYTLNTSHPLQPPEFDPPYPGQRQLPAGESPFSTPFTHRRHSMLIEPAAYLSALIRDFELAGGKIVIRSFASRQDLAALTEPLLFNCTGLGAKSLFGDEELTPIRGQLVVLMPQPGVNYMTLGPGNIYMFPRRDGILLGGSFQRGESNLAPDPAITERILRENKAIFDAMKA